MKYPIIVIGAGLSGLLAARTLQKVGLPVVVFEKSRGLGGRMATRRMGNAVLDHGAQFFTVRDPRFQDLVSGWVERGLVTEWARGFAALPGLHEQDGHPRYRGVPGMTAVPKHLAQGLDVRSQTRIVSIELADRTWRVQSENGDTFKGGALVLTAPVPQSLALLESVRTFIPGPDWLALEKLVYDPCIALLLQTELDSRIPPPGGLQLNGPDIRWIADNTQKGISPHAPALTIHTTPAFSQANWDAGAEAIFDTLLPQLSEWLEGPIQEYQVHRWRYSQPQQVYPGESLLVPGPPPLVFAGDVFGGPRVEGAALSGLSAGESLLQLLKGS